MVVYHGFGGFLQMVFFFFIFLITAIVFIAGLATLIPIIANADKVYLEWSKYLAAPYEIFKLAFEFYSEMMIKPS